MNYVIEGQELFSLQLHRIEFRVYGLNGSEILLVTCYFVKHYIFTIFRTMYIHMRERVIKGVET
jgi:hypothetical protein